MKPTQVTELFSNIKSTIVSFFSILMFVALGVAVFAGINWIASALFDRVDTELENQVFHHIQIQFPYGLDESDLEQLRQVEGVDEVDAARQSFQTMLVDGARKTVKVQSLPGDIDQLLLVEGELARSPDEIVLQSFSAAQLNLGVGDTLQFVPDGTDGESEMQYLRKRSFKIVGIAESAEYLAEASYAFGYAPIGSGEINAVGWVPLSSFKTNAFYDAYPVVNIRSESLEGLNTFTSAYKDASSKLETRIADLGDKLADTRYRTLHEQAEKAIDTGESKLTDAREQISQGETQLSEAQTQIDKGETLVTEGNEQLAEAQEKIAAGEKELEDARRQLEDGQRQLAEGQTEFEARQQEALAQLNEALATLEEGQAAYDEAEQTLNQIKEMIAELTPLVESVRQLYDTVVDRLKKFESTYEELRRQYNAGEIDMTTFWERTRQAYENFHTEYESLNTTVANINASIELAKILYPDNLIIGLLPELPTLPNIPDNIDGAEGSLDDALALIDSAIELARNGLDRLKKATITVAGRTISFDTISHISTYISDYIGEREEELAAQKASLDDGWAQYEDGVTRYNNEMDQAQSQFEQAEAQIAEIRERIAQGERELEDARAQLAAGQAEIKEKTAELETGKTTIKEKTTELEAAKSEVEQQSAKLDDAKEQLRLMKDYDWTVASRQYNLSIIEATNYANVTTQLSISMAALFLIVGLLVSYSAIGRLVNEQISQIGTKKALGLRNGEITASFLLYAALAVALGSVFGLLIGVFIVERLLGDALAKRFYVDDIPAFFNLPVAGFITGLELVLIVGTAWFACRKILGENAVVLLKGAKPPAGKERFFEKWKLWESLPLYTQTIVNNCLNDKRRMFSTIVGVAGCTALVVTAITLNNNIVGSYNRHYDTVYHFNAVSYVSDDEPKAIDNTLAVLEKSDAQSLPVLYKNHALRLPDGNLGRARIVVPSNTEEFSSFIQIVRVDGADSALSDEGAWVNIQYKTHQGAQIGDEIEIIGTDGSNYRIPIVGFHDHYLPYYEVLMSKNAYEHFFGNEFKANAILSNTGEIAVSAIEPELVKTAGFERITDDKIFQASNFKAFSNVSSTVVLIYLVLAILMAIVVLLNLNVMFIDEKKRELIVLMINGFSTKDAKRYVYNDTIVLTVIGIILGLVLGSIIGIISIASTEIATMNLIKEVNLPALAIGAAVSAVLAFIMSAIALRRVPRFNLTDINHI
ncbi:MAG: FtsX-like permease family protein [Eggerthellaceae bacterium]|nr:FtsX-like permease family protein [Eggerthellaceae bacterium]